MYRSHGIVNDLEHVARRAHVTREFANLDPDTNGTLCQRVDNGLASAGNSRQTLAIALPFDGLDAGKLVEDRVRDPLLPGVSESLGRRLRKGPTAGGRQREFRSGGRRETSGLNDEGPGVGSDRPDVRVPSARPLGCRIEVPADEDLADGIDAFLRWAARLGADRHTAAVDQLQHAEDLARGRVFGFGHDKRKVGANGHGLLDRRERFFARGRHKSAQADRQIVRDEVAAPVSVECAGHHEESDEFRLGSGSLEGWPVRQ